ncbi:MAG: energy transducer TonB [Deltaproteobacteria bacterium]|nr:energy transducer TonB [Deltaproteobacteria bacterium]
MTENSPLIAGDTQKYFLPELYARCDEVPHCRPTTRFLAIFAFFASLLIHTCVIAGGMYLFHGAPPTAFPAGEAIEVHLVTLHIPAANSQSSGAHAETPPSAIPENRDAGRSVSTKPPSSPRSESVPTGVQPRKNERAIRQTREHACQESDRLESGKDTQPAGNGQSSSHGGTQHGHGGSVNASLPVPFGAHINPRPAYPEIARQRGQEGQVVLLVNVDIHGNPAKVLLEASSEHSLLDREAIKTIRRWKFKPASRNGEVIPGIVRVPVAFRLR